MTLIAQTGDSQSGPAGDKYTGLDRFGRLVNKRWFKTGTSSPVVDLVRAQYTCDRAGNRLANLNPVAEAAGVNFDQSFGYDGLYQVMNHQTGIGTVFHLPLVGFVVIQYSLKIQRYYLTDEKYTHSMCCNVTHHFSIFCRKRNRR